MESNRKKVVMVCEDEQELLELYSKVLELRYDVIKVCSGYECINKYLERKTKGSTIYLLFLVYKLGDMLGDAVAKKIKELLFPSLKVDAFFFATNTLAVESLKIINQSGIKVPDDLAVIAFDESDAFDFFYCPLSYVSQSLEDMGKEAVKLITEKIGNKSKKHNNIIVKEKLVLRESSGSRGNK